MGKRRERAGNAVKRERLRFDRHGKRVRYGNIAPFETKSNATTFRFNVSGSAPYNTDLAFNLNVVGTGFNVNIPLTIPTAPGITYVHGTLNTQTWTNDRTYIVDNNAGVPAGQTLTIQPGTVVKFRDNYNLTINGTLIADGTASQQIHFTREVTKTWGQIQFTNTSTPAAFDGSGNYTGGSIIRNAIVEYGQGIRLAPASPFVASNTFRNIAASCLAPPCANGRSIAIEGNPTVGLRVSDNVLNGAGIVIRVMSSSGGENISVLRNQVVGGYIATYSAAIISGNSVTDCSSQETDYGIYGGGNSTSILVVTDNRVIGCTKGIVVSGGGSISGNLVANSTNYGLGLYTSSTTTVSNNTLINNNLAGLYIEDNIENDPLSVIVRDNNLIASTGGYAVRLTSNYTNNVDATGNYWGTTSDAAIQAAIYDGMDEFGPSIVNYSGYLSDAVQNAPAYVQNVTVQPDTTLGIQTGTFNVEFSKPMNQDTNPSAGFSSTKKDHGRRSCCPIP